MAACCIEINKNEVKIQIIYLLLFNYNFNRYTTVINSRIYQKISINFASVLSYEFSHSFIYFKLFLSSILSLHIQLLLSPAPFYNTFLSLESFEPRLLLLLLLKILQGSINLLHIFFGYQYYFYLSQEV